MKNFKFYISENKYLDVADVENNNLYSYYLPEYTKEEIYKDIINKNFKLITNIKDLNEAFEFGGSLNKEMYDFFSWEVPQEINFEEFKKLLCE